MTSRRSLLFAVAVLLCASGVRAQEGCATALGSSSFPIASVVQVVTASSASAFSGPIESAMGQWNSSCGSAGGFEYPELSTSTGPDLNIQYQSGHAASLGCNGGTAYCTADWNSSTRTMTIYEEFGAPGSLQRFDGLSSAAQATIIAHEIGHAFGVADSTCSGGLMNGNMLAGAGLTSEECQVANEKNSTRIEREDAVWRQNQCSPWPDCEESPILIDLDRNGFTLTSSADGVLFDLNGDGRAERVSWTEAGSGDAFLWIDLDENGVVDNGYELFGALMASNGFERLAQFDRAGEAHVTIGGNDDGALDSSDAMWSNLRLWIDRNHDGVSQQDEILTMAEGGVERIQLEHHWSGRRDRHGNEFRYGARVELTHGKATHASQAYDVWLVVER